MNVDRILSVLYESLRGIDLPTTYEQDVPNFMRDELIPGQPFCIKIDSKLHDLHWLLDTPQIAQMVETRLDMVRKAYPNVMLYPHYHNAPSFVKLTEGVFVEPRISHGAVGIIVTMYMIVPTQDDAE